MATTSYFSFTKDEKEMINKMLQLSSNGYSFIEKELGALLDPCKMCEDHQLPYSFYNDEQFFCPKCLDILRPKIFRYIEEDDQVIINQLKQNLKNYEQFEIPKIDFEVKAKQLMNEEQQNMIEEIGSFQKLKENLEARKKFIAVQDFISQISLEKTNRIIHDEMHNADKKMKPNFEQKGQLDNTKDFEKMFKKFFQ
ncbi:unnamed protein product [Paramecium sonneborni]|uniref:Uncharacterized protein n=1 Tax=Paramecium sonneborni TaxID=65129 RepID=A0A8S1QM11_9CILI|nr:unnamed protein product [Paramecium sonneborni]